MQREIARALYDWEKYFIVIGWEQANLLLVALQCKLTRERLQFSQSYNKWVIIGKFKHY